jgi:hypothetical protein
VAKGYMLDGLGLSPSKGIIFFSSPQFPCQFWGPPSLLMNGFWEVKWPGLEADHSAPSRGEAKNSVAIPPLPMVE